MPKRLTLSEVEYFDRRTVHRRLFVTRVNYGYHLRFYGISCGHSCFHPLFSVVMNAFAGDAEDDFDFL